MANPPKSKKADPRTQEYDPAVPVGKLKPHPDNPNDGDPEAIAESIEESGFAGAVLAQKRTGFIIAGEHTWRAVQARGDETVPVLFVDCGAREAKRLLVSFNNLPRKGRFRPDALMAILEELQNEHEHGIAGTGFGMDEFARLQQQLMVTDLRKDASALDPEHNGVATFGNPAHVDYEDAGAMVALSFMVPAAARPAIMTWLRGAAAEHGVETAGEALAILAGAAVNAS